MFPTKHTRTPRSLHTFPPVHHTDHQGVVMGGSRDPAMCVDKYTAGIELSNACRQFYVNRVKASAKVKERLGMSEERRGSTSSTSTGRTASCAADQATTTRSATTAGSASNLSTPATSQPDASKPITPIDSAMHVLKRELTSLIDQDLALMGQLLTLNEQIEELKWQRKLRGYVRGSVESSCTLDTSNYSMCESSDVCASGLDMCDFIPKYPSPSELSLYTDSSPRISEERDIPTGIPQKVTSHSCHDRPETSTSDLGSSDDMVNSAPYRQASSEVPWIRADTCATTKTATQHPNGTQDQHSFDSGIHVPEPSHPAEFIL